MLRSGIGAGKPKAPSHPAGFSAALEEPWSLNEVPQWGVGGLA